MEVLRIICTVVMLLSAVALIVIVLFQSGKSAGLSGAIAGNADSFMSKNKNRSWGNIPQPTAAEICGGFFAQKY